MLFLKRLHKNTIEWVNIERIKAGMDPIQDLPTGIKDDDRSPVELVMPGEGRGEFSDAFRDITDNFENDFPAIIAEAVLVPSFHSCALWTLLFAMGFYPRYNWLNGLPKPLKRRQRWARFIRDEIRDVDVTERYLRLKQYIDGLDKSRQTG